MSEDKTTERNAGKQVHSERKAKQTYTKRNEDFMFRLTKELNENDKLSEEKKEEALQDTKLRLLEGQLKGETAKQIYGTPTDRVKEIIEGPKKAPVETKYWMKALDNGMVFLMIFALMFGIMMIFQPKSVTSEPGPAGITACHFNYWWGMCTILNGPFATNLQKEGTSIDLEDNWDGDGDDFGMDGSLHAILIIATKFESNFAI